MIKNKHINVLFSCLISSFICLLIPNYSAADDTEIYDNFKSSSKTNVLFVLDLSGSMLLELPTAGNPTRLMVMKEALSLILNDPKLKDINVGMMSFSGVGSGYSAAHGPVYPAVDIDSPASNILFGTNPLFTSQGGSYLPPPDLKNSRQFLTDVANSWGAGGLTPIVDALYESALYFRGDAVDFGNYPVTDRRSAHPSTYTGLRQLVALPDLEVCPYKTCYGDACDVATKICTPYNAGEKTRSCYESDIPTCLAKHPDWISCKPTSKQSCKTTCPKEKYNEIGQCIEPGKDCTTINYFHCIDPYPAGTYCKHNVCYMKKQWEVQGSPVYRSPITDECQNNLIMLLSDGRPTRNTHVTAVYNAMPTKYSNNCTANGDSVLKDTAFYGRCGPELAHYLSSEDQSSNVTGKQTITTSTIGFALEDGSEASKYLAALAKKGGGKFYRANNVQSLVKSFANGISDVVKGARSFSSPSYSIDEKNLLAHTDEVFLPLFSYQKQPLWSGNLKKFKLSDGKIIDKKGDSAINIKGSLRNDAKDEWGTGALKHPVNDGGAASLLDPVSRTLYTEIGGVLHEFSKETTNIKTLLGDPTMTGTHAIQLIDFIRGYTAEKKSSRHHMGDIIHSKPVIVPYDGKQRVFVGTNEGYLHAFDTASGEEKYAYMPQILLKNIEAQYQDDPEQMQHPYGVDGEITVWIKDDNNNGKVDGSEKAYLFFGLRRGGQAYYALDISDPDSPKFLWKIDNSTSNFAQLGQTWSTPLLTQLRYNKSANLAPVLIFGGGYNTHVDQQGSRPAASTANAGTDVYIVNALTGDLVWHADQLGHTIKHAVPSNIRALDMDHNGSVDRLYFGDMGGNIWRVDLNFGDFDSANDLHDLTKAKLSKLASLGANTGSDTRKFFYEPDVSFFKYHGKFYLSVSVGSGYRSHPLDTNIVDRFYSLRDQYVLRRPDIDFKTITEAMLLKAPVAKTQDVFDKNYYGWFFDLIANKDEKVLSSALTFMNRVSFTTFGLLNTPKVSQDCGVNQNFESRLYILDLLWGSPTVDFDTSKAGKETSAPVSGEEIIMTPQVIFNKPKSSKDTACTKDDCSQSVSLRAGKKGNAVVDESTTGGNVDITDSLLKVFWRDIKQ
ncbi:MAG: hypothetical protein KAG28_04565 [Cocleimonas sp.]|nr:hypothetical protein [Cocleimonas sp.]